jgi:hypothetical protein
VVERPLTSARAGSVTLDWWPCFVPRSTPADPRAGRGDLPRPGWSAARPASHVPCRRRSHDLRHFLEESGYLHIEGLFTEDEMRGLQRHGPRRARYAPDDGHRGGEDRGRNELVRCRPSTNIRLDERADRRQEVSTSPRSPATVTPSARSDNRIEALFSRSAWSRESPTCPGTRTAASAVTRTSAAVSRSGSR